MADGPDRPPRGRDRAVTKAEHQPAPPRRKGRETTAQGYTYDLRQDLENKAGQTRSIYGSRGRAPAREDGYQAWRDKHNHAWAESHIQTSFELRHDMARYRGASHPLCFTDEVMEHQFLEGFKPVNIESYDGKTDPAIWIEDYLLHIHMARGDDLQSNTSHSSLKD